MSSETTIEYCASSRIGGFFELAFRMTDMLYTLYDPQSTSRSIAGF